MNDALNEFPNTRSIGSATEADTKMAMQYPDAMCEWEFFNQSFIYSTRAMVIMRIDGVGSETPNVAWALKYANPFSLMRDWQEIESVPGSVRVNKRG